MKKLFLIFLIIITTVTIGWAETENIPPKDPKCKDDEKAICSQSCHSTALACGQFGTFENGKFIEQPYHDCNITTCTWNCYCIKIKDIKDEK